MRCKARGKELSERCELEAGHDEMHERKAGERPTLVTKWTGPDLPLLFVDLNVFDDSTGEFFRKAIIAMEKDGVLIPATFNVEMLTAHFEGLLRDPDLMRVPNRILATVLAERTFAMLQLEREVTQDVSSVVHTEEVQDPVSL